MTQEEKENKIIEIIKQHIDYGKTGNLNLAQEIIEALNQSDNVVLDDVIKCDYCGDVGRVEPTVQYPDGIKCYKCP